MRIAIGIATRGRPAILAGVLRDLQRQTRAPDRIIVCHVMICPTNPAVPIPEPVALFVIWSTIVPTGPRIALDIIAGSQITGFFTIFGTCSIEVPIPCAKSPPTLFSR